MLHTSISPNIVQAGYQVNVIPCEAEGSMDVRALPDEDISAFYDLMRKVIDDPAIELIPDSRNARPGSRAVADGLRRLSRARSGIPAYLWRYDATG